MNWSSVKNLLIAILVAANLFLIYNIARQDRSRKYFDREDIDAAVMVLAERGLMVEDGCVPLKKFNASVYESLYNDEYYAVVAEALANSPRELLLSLPDGGFSITAKNGTSMDFDSEFGFSYAVDDTFADIAYTDISAESFAYHAQNGEELRGSLHKSLSEKCADFLSTRFAAEYDLDTEVADSFYDSDQGLYYLLAYQTLDGYEVYSHYAVCVFRDKELVGAYGRWFFFGFDKVHAAEPADQINILFSDLTTLREDRTAAFSADYGDDSGMIPSQPSGSVLSTVCKMEACYATYWNAGKTALYFIPAWRLDHSDGQTLVYNATNGTLYARGE